MLASLRHEAHEALAAPPYSAQPPRPTRRTQHANQVNSNQPASSTAPTLATVILIVDCFVPLTAGNEDCKRNNCR